jgi:hypothetical protein
MCGIDISGKSKMAAGKLEKNGSTGNIAKN